MNHCRSPRLVTTGVILLGVAGALIGWRTHTVESTQWVPIDVPFPLTPASIPAQTFTIDRAGGYEVVVKIRRPPQGPERFLAECLLGFDPWNPHWGVAAGGPRCVEAPTVDLTWRVTSDTGPAGNVTGDVIAEGRASGIADAGGFSDAEVDRWLGSFVTKRGPQYTLRAETHAVAETLQPFSPRLVVQPSPSIKQDEAIATTFVWMTAGLCGSAGIAALLVAVVRSRRSKGSESVA